MKGLDFPLFAAGLAAVLSGAGCRTTREVLDDYEMNYARGAYEEASKEVSELAAEEDDSQLMYGLLAASALRNFGADASANILLDRAEDVMVGYDTESAFASGAHGAMAMMTNDRAFPYDGGGQDRVFTCLYKAINYAAAGDSAAARTEFNRAEQYQENWLWQRRKDISAAQERLDEEAAEYAKENKSDSGDSGKIAKGVLANKDFCAQLEENLGYDAAKSGDLDRLHPSDWTNPYASHVMGVFRWINGDPVGNCLRDSAQYRRDCKTAAADSNMQRKGETPSDTVWVWVEDGLCPMRKEWRIDLPIVLIPYANKYILYAGMAFPKLEYRQTGANGWTVMTSGENVNMEELADIDKLIKLEYDVYLRGALTREITRTVVKIGAQVALGIAADNTNDWRVELALRASQAGVAAWALSTTAADERSWTALPKRVLVGKVRRPADGKIVIVADGGTVAEVVLPEGNSMVFVTKPAPGAAAAVKTANFPNR